MLENDNLENNNEETQKIKETESSFNIWKEVWEWFYTIIIALVIAVTIKVFIFDIVRVDGPSMYPTLVNNDRLVVTKLGYKPHQGDIIILDSNYKNRNEYFKEYEEVNDTELNIFSKARLYLKLPKDLKIKFYVKRIIGMPGDIVDIVDGQVLVNGKVLDEPYYDGVTEDYDINVEYPFTVSEGYVFVMGDNRPNSKDSRSSALGEVPIKAISGKSQYRLWPFNAIGKTK